MPIIIDQSQLPQVIKNKYKLVNNSLRNPVLTDIKNRINIEIGDINTLTDFLPHIKLGRWGDGEDSNEVSFSLKIIEKEPGQPKLSFSGEKIVWEKGNIKIEYEDFPSETAQKMVWYFKAKPKTNKLQFTLDFKDLTFHHQRPLTEELNPAEWDVLTETFAERGDPNGDNHEVHIRPENVIGSYAIYHASKGGMNLAGSKDYKVGKAFHIYRPKIIGNDGNWVWGKLVIDIQAKTYTVEIPQTFLDTAVYPIRSNDTFGHDPGSQGASNYEGTADNIWGAVYTCSATGNATHLSWYNWQGTRDDGPQRLILYEAVGGVFVGETADVQDQPFDQYVTLEMTTNPAISAQDYILCHYGEEFSLAYDTVYYKGKQKSYLYPGETPKPITWDIEEYDKHYSLYCTYTTVGGQTYYQTLPATEISSASIGIAKSFYRTLLATEISIATISLLKTFYRTLGATEISVPKLYKGLFGTLSATEISSPTLTKALILSKLLSVQEISTATLSGVTTFFRTLIATMISNPVLTKLKTFYRTLSATEISIPNLALLKTFYRTLATTLTGIPSLTKAFLYTKTLTATELSVATLLKGIIYSKLLSVQEVSLANLTKLLFYFRTLSATMIANPKINLLKTLYRTLSAVEISIPSITRTFYKRLSVVMVSIPNLIAKFISGIGTIKVFDTVRQVINPLLRGRIKWVKKPLGWKPRITWR